MANRKRKTAVSLVLGVVGLMTLGISFAQAQWQMTVGRGLLSICSLILTEFIKGAAPQFGKVWADSMLRGSHGGSLPPPPRQQPSGERFPSSPPPPLSQWPLWKFRG